MKKDSKRNYGIDLLRIMSMLGVVILHNLYQGGILPQLKTSSPNWWQFWLLENLSIVAVNVFAMITGYVSMMHRFKSDRVLQVVFQTVFWSATVAVVLYQIGLPISVETVKASFYPVAKFWYVNAYIGLFLLSPVLEFGVKHLTRRTFRRLLIVMLIVSAGLDAGGNFFLLNGYSTYWLVVMYLVGAYIQLYPEAINWKPIAFLSIYFVMACLSTYLQWNAQWFHTNKWWFIRYTSPFVIVEAIAVFIWGVRLKISSRLVKALLKFFAPISFGVYLIDESNFYDVLLPKMLTGMIREQPNFFALRILGISLLLYLAFAMFDFVRLLIFKLYHVNQALKLVDHSGEWLIDKL